MPRFKQHEAVAICRSAFFYPSIEYLTIPPGDAVDDRLKRQRSPSRDGGTRSVVLFKRMRSRCCGD